MKLIARVFYFAQADTKVSRLWCYGYLSQLLWSPTLNQGLTFHHLDYILRLVITKRTIQINEVQ